MSPKSDFQTEGGGKRGMQGRKEKNLDSVTTKAYIFMLKCNTLFV